MILLLEITALVLLCMALGPIGFFIWLVLIVLIALYARG